MQEFGFICRLKEILRKKGKKKKSERGGGGDPALANLFCF